MSLHHLTRSLRQLLTQRQEARSRRKATARLSLLTLESRLAPANASGVISGVAFLDANRDGLRQANETALPGVTFVLRGTTGTGSPVASQVTTGVAGGFRFLNVMPGAYQVFANPVAGLAPLSANGALLPGAVGGAKVVLSRGLAGGATLGVQAGFVATSPQAVSLTQLLNSTAPTAPSPLLTPGSGGVLVTFRPNERPTLRTAIANITTAKNSADRVIDLAGHFTDANIRNSRVRIVTSEGDVNVVLFEVATPQTVQNFLNYVLSNRYDNSVFHRLAFKNASATSTAQIPFVLQGGGFTFENNPSRLNEIVTDPAVRNEPGVSNTRGTLAMAKLGSDPNSATDQFFFNLNNNGTDGVTNLDTQNGGFTAFGRLATDADQAVVNRLAVGPTRPDLALDSPFDQIPLRNYTGTKAGFPGTTTASNYFMIRDVVVTQRNETLTYSVVSNTNQGLVTARIKDNRLTLDFANDATGTATITVRARDRFGASVTTSFNVTVNNTAPTVGVTVAPSAPNTNSVLTATATPADANSDPVNLTYVWTRRVGSADPVEIQRTTTTATTNTLDLSQAGNGDRGDIITVTVTPNDGTTDGTAASASRTIIDSVPVISNLAFNPTAPGTNDTLTVTTTASDLDGDALTFTYVWTVNDLTVKTTTNVTSTTDTLDLSVTGNGNAGDTIRVSVTATGNAQNSTVVSNSVVVA